MHCISLVLLCTKYHQQLNGLKQCPLISSQFCRSESSIGGGGVSVQDEISVRTSACLEALKKYLLLSYSCYWQSSASGGFRAEVLAAAAGFQWEPLPAPAPGAARIPGHVALSIFKSTVETSSCSKPPQISSSDFPVSDLRIQI